MNNDNFEYHSLNEQELESVCEKHTQLIQGFISNNGYRGEDIFVNENSLLSIIVKVEQRRKYFKSFHKIDMSEYKEAALNAFWYIKLSPLSVGSRELSKQQPKTFDSLNEKMALYIILTTFRAMLEKAKISTKKLDEIPSKYINELIYSLTYRDISKEAMILLVESIAVFLGLDPYAQAHK